MYVKQNHKKNKKSIIIVALVLALVLISSVGLLHKLGVISIPYFSSRDTSLDQSGPTEQQIQQEADTDAANKKQAVEQPTNNNNQSQPNDSEAKLELSARQESSGTVTILTKIFNSVGSDCTLTINNGIQSKTYKAPVIYQPEFSSCAGFSINKNELGTGNWQIKLLVGSLEQSIAFEVK